jgi:dihydrodipicolinate synthase/N-acetylneuraminate lyase
MHAALCINPYYGKTSKAGLLEHFKQCLNEGPAIIYNVPGRTGQDITQVRFTVIVHLSPHLLSLSGPAPPSPPAPMLPLLPFEEALFWPAFSQPSCILIRPFVHIYFNISTQDVVESIAPHENFLGMKECAGNQRIQGYTSQVSISAVKLFAEITYV